LLVGDWTRVVRDATDGHADLAVGAPLDSVQGEPSAGAVNVVHGGSGGLSDLAGDWMGIDQQHVFRPAPRLCRYRTRLRGLVRAGASVHPGPAVHGVIGAGAARALLRDVPYPPARLTIGHRG
jgi:hypothetical protein